MTEHDESQAWTVEDDGGSLWSAFDSSESDRPEGGANVTTDELRNEWGAKMRPRLRSWVDRSICRWRGHRMVPLRATWTERREDGPWTHKAQDEAGSVCDRCGIGEVSIEFTPDLGVFAVDDIRATK